MLNLRTAIEAISSGRSRIASLAGITFGGNRNIFEVCGYDRVITAQKYRDRYRRNAVAARLIEAKPQATWRGGAEVIEDEDPNVITEFEAIWDTLRERLKVFAILQRADIVSGLGQYGVILIGAPGDIETPLPQLDSPEDVRYLQVFAEEDSLVDTWNKDPLSERWGLPEYYMLRRVPPFGSTGITVPFSSVGRKAHWTRCIHLADGLLDDNVYAPPKLERVWNLLDDLEKVTGGGSEAFWKRADSGIHLNVDPELDFDATDEAKTEEQLHNYLHKMRRSLVTRGIDIKNLGSQVANFKGPMDAIISQISAGTGIPQRILMGSERGQLASTQDDDNWSERITDRRNAFAGPLVVRPLVDRLIKFGALPEPSQYEVRWPEIKNLDVLQRAQVASIWAKLNSDAQQVVVTGNEIRDRLLDLPPMAFDALPDTSLGDQGLPVPEPAAAMFARKWAILSIDKRRQVMARILSRSTLKDVDLDKYSKQNSLDQPLKLVANE